MVHLPASTAKATAANVAKMMTMIIGRWTGSSLLQRLRGIGATSAVVGNSFPTGAQRTSIVPRGGTA